MLELPSWLVYLGVELIILLIVVIVFLMVAWQRSSKKHRKQVMELTLQLRDSKNKLKKCKTGTADKSSAQSKKPADSEIKALREEVEILKIQLEQARNNPFMQEKIDALMAENEDLQAELDSFRN